MGQFWLCATDDTYTKGVTAAYADTSVVSVLGYCARRATLALVSLSMTGARDVPAQSANMNLHRKIN